MTDVNIQNEGNIFLVFPNTTKARCWIDEHTEDEAQRFGPALVVEHRYIEPLVAGLIDAGFTVA